MSDPLCQSAASLIGAGMKAMGIDGIIPVSDTSARMIDGMRSFGLPVPPKSWFRRSSGGEASAPAIRTPEKDIYDTLESHIKGMMRVVKPAIELKKLVRDEYLRPGRYLQVPAENSASGYQANDNGTRRSLSASVYPNSSQDDITINRLCSECEYQRRRRRSTGNIENEEVFGDNSRSRPPYQLASDHVFCSECGQARGRDLESNMPRTIQNTENTTTLPEPVDFIDLTQDSPHNTALRLSRIDTESTSGQTQNDPIVIHSIISKNLNKGPQTRRMKSNNRAVVINLEDTINLDDSGTNSNIPKQTSIVPPRTPDSMRPALTCPICLDSLSNDNLKAMTTPCGHIYCLDCLKTITNSKETCSICKRAIKFSKCIRLHI